MPTDANVSALLARAVEDLGYPPERLPSGADHEAAAVAEIAPIAMLFVRCNGGVSHNPDESVEPDDIAMAIEATSRFLALLADSLDR
jgi:allantoate deiminase